MTRFSVVLVLAAAAAQAQDIDVSEPTISRGQGWSVYTGKTVGNGETVVGGEVGWPGLYGFVLKGVSPKVDLGGRVGLTYGQEGIVTQGTVPGISLQGVARIALLHESRFNLGVTF